MFLWNKDQRWIRWRLTVVVRDNFLIKHSHLSSGWWTETRIQHCQYSGAHANCSMLSADAHHDDDCHCKKMIVSEHPHCNVERSNALRSLTGARCLKWMSAVVVTGSVTVTTTTIMLRVAPTKVSPYFGSLMETTGWTLCLSASFELGFRTT